MPLVPVEQEGAHPDGPRSLDVVLERVGDHRRGPGPSAQPVEDPADDALHESDPDLLVVLELGMALDPHERRLAGVLVPGRIEREPVAAARPAVALRTEVGAGPRDRSVDVEKDGLKGHTGSDTAG